MVWITGASPGIGEALARGKQEIPVGKGKEMAALWVKRVAPEIMFKLARKQN